MSEGDNKVFDRFLEELEADAPGAADEVTKLVDEIPAETPSPGARDALLTALSCSRFERFAAQVANLLDVDEEAAQRLLDGIDQSENWEEGLTEGMELYHVEGGPAVERSITGFIRLESGGQFPPHTHLGDEAVLVIQGYYVDDVSGQEYGPGDVARLPGGSAHSFSVLAASTGLLYLAVIQEGLQIGDEVMRYDDPRM